MGWPTLTSGSAPDPLRKLPALSGPFNWTVSKGVGWVEKWSPSLVHHLHKPSRLANSRCGYYNISTLSVNHCSYEITRHSMNGEYLRHTKAPLVLSVAWPQVQTRGVRVNGKWSGNPIPMGIPREWKMLLSCWWSWGWENWWRWCCCQCHCETTDYCKK